LIARNQRGLHICRIKQGESCAYKSIEQLECGPLAYGPPEDIASKCQGRDFQSGIRKRTVLHLLLFLFLSEVSVLISRSTANISRTTSQGNGQASFHLSESLTPTEQARFTTPENAKARNGQSFDIQYFVSALKVSPEKAARRVEAIPHARLRAVCQLAVGEYILKPEKGMTESWSTR
jgi:hypothetical protein